VDASGPACDLSAAAIELAKIAQRLPALLVAEIDSPSSALDRTSACCRVA